MYLFLFIIILIVAGVIAFFAFRRAARNRIIDSFRTSLFLVKIPKPSGEEKPGNAENKDFKLELAHFEQLLAGLSAIKKPFTFEIAVSHIGEEIHFYLSVPKLAGEIATKQIQGLWNGASVALVEDDFTVFNAHGTSVAAYVTQKENYALPVKTYADLGIDSFESILGAFAKINEIGEGAALQMIVQPASSGYKKEIQHAVERLKKGESLKKVVGGNCISSPTTMAWCER